MLKKIIPIFIIVFSAGYLFWASTSSLKYKTVVRDEPVHWNFAHNLINDHKDPSAQRGVGAVTILNVLPFQLTGHRLFTAQGLVFARWPTVFLGVLLVVFTGIFAGQLFGYWGGAMAAFMVAFEPNIIAHSRFVTTDIPLTLGIISFTFAAWLHHNHPTWIRLLFIGIAAGFTLSAKSTGLIVYILLPIYLGITGIKNNGTIKSVSFWKHFFISIVIILVVIILCINTAYLFDGTFKSIHQLNFKSDLLQSVSQYLPGWIPVPFPEIYIDCLDSSFQHADYGHFIPAFLMGKYSHEGFHSYHVIGFMIKSTLGMIVLVLMSIFLLGFKKFRAGWGEWFIWLPVVIIFGYFIIFNKICIGLRYILPVYPLLCVSLARLTRIEFKKWIAFVIILVPLISHAYASVSIWPHYLEFFNQLIGGPDQGYKYLNDSNLDWGQDLFFVEQYRKGSKRPLIMNPKKPTNGLVAINSNRMCSGNYEWLQAHELVDRIAYTWFIFDVKGENRMEEGLNQPINPRMRGIAKQLIGPKINQYFDGDNRQPKKLQKSETINDILTQVENEHIIQQNPFNLVIISIDTLRSDHLSMYGHHVPVSPFMDSFSRKSFLFSKMRCQIPRTTPSHSSLLTGLYPGEHGSLMNCQPIKNHISTLAEILRVRKYSTGAVVSSAVLSAKGSGLHRGFDNYDDKQFEDPLKNSVEEKNESTGTTTSSVNAVKKEILFFGGKGENKADVQPFQRDAREATDLAIHWVKDLDYHRPFFMFLHYFDPHSSYNPPQPYNQLFASFYSSKGRDLDILGFSHNGTPFNLTEYNRFHGLYDGEIRYVDNQIERFFQVLADDGRLNNTLIVITADHGETLGEYNAYVGHGKHLNEGSMRVPLLIHIPGQTTHRIIRQTMNTVDIMPTILDLLRIEISQEISGRSLFPLMNINAEDQISGFSYMMSSLQNPEKENSQFKVGLTFEEFKYVGIINIAEIKRSPLSKWMINDVLLYDLENDIEEKTNVLNRYPRRVERMKTMLVKWLQNGDLGQAAEVEISDETRGVLKALGYLQD